MVKILSCVSLAWNVLPLNLLFKQEACRELFLPFFLLFSSGHGDILTFESDQNFQEFQFHLLISMSNYWCITNFLWKKVESSGIFE